MYLKFALFRKIGNIWSIIEKLTIQYDFLSLLKYFISSLKTNFHTKNRQKTLTKTYSV